MANCKGIEGIDVLQMYMVQSESESECKSTSHGMEWNPFLFGVIQEGKERIVHKVDVVFVG